MPFPFINGQATVPPNTPVELPVPARDAQLDPAGYLMDQPLVDAVNVALLLSQPLLLTGDPGTGKTQLAYRIAWELGLAPPLRFDTKSASVARDVLYQFDTLGRFHAANTNSGSQENVDYITYHALGAAILLSQKRESVAHLFSPERFTHTGAQRSVVLVDEIDKAPRDFPNDLLLEVDALSFRMTELDNELVTADPELRPILILTSNSEQNLPDAFLRRCIYYHIPSPDKTRLTKIVCNRMANMNESHESCALLDSALDFFIDVQDKVDLTRKPATAELLNWLQALEAYGVSLDMTIMSAPESLKKSLPTLAKTKDDAEKLTKWVESILPQAS